MAARGATGKPALAVLARERQDLVAEWQKRDASRNAALAQAPNKRDAKAEAENQARLAAIDTRIAEIDKRLASEFPDYAALASPAPLTVEEVQAQLGADEALVLFLDTRDWKPTPEETFIWVVTKTDMRWVRNKIGRPSLQREVQALRCGLDKSNWFDPSRFSDAGHREAQQARRAKCKELLDRESREGDLPPFDLKRSHDLYTALFGQTEDLTKGKHLIVVSSGPLTSLPFQVLVTKAPDPALPDAEAYRQARWLGIEQPLSVLPSVASLKALRQFAETSKAGRPFIGFGDPLLEGDTENAGDKTRAKQARDWQRCSALPAQRLEFADAGRPSPRLNDIYRGSYANVLAIRAQTPLPGTSEELCTIARTLGVSEGDLDSAVYLGGRMKKTDLFRMNGEKPGLEQYRIVQFATHGAVVGQLGGMARFTEPGLVLTPSYSNDAREVEADNGYLSASEIAELKLDADWVVLSACNTAAGDGGNAETYSGLARAFFFAHARAILASHWLVSSRAAVTLTTGAFEELKAHPNIGRAEAMRRAMKALVLDKGWPEAAHPAIWAPFVLIGEGGSSTKTNQ